METGEVPGTVETAPVVEAPTTPPAQAVDAAAAGNAPPAKEVAREAFDRLARGESPEAVNKELYRDPPAEARKATATPDAAGPQPHARLEPDRAGTTRTTTEPSREAPASAAEQGVTPEDLQVLRRAKFDMSAWGHIPPSNRKAIVGTLRQSQAEADRQFQRARTGNDPQGQQAAAPATSQTQTGRQDEATPPVDQTHVENEQKPAANAAAQNQQAPHQGPSWLPQIDVNALIDPKDLETLRTLGGDELAETHQRGIARAVGLMQQQMAPMAGIVGHLLNQWEESEFSQAIKSLKEQPGFDQLTPEQIQAVRDKSNLLIRAAGDAQNYRHLQSVPDAAASLFRTNVQQAAQQALLKARTASLRGSPERGVGKLPADRPTDAKERNRMIFEKLSEGLSPHDARRAVDGR